MKDNLLRFKPKQKYIIFDIESESLSLVHSRAWQLAWIESEGGTVTKNQDRFLYWPDLQMSEGAARVTRFDKYMWEAKAEKPEDVLADFDKVLYDPEYIILGANLLGFDIFQHNNCRRAVGLNTDYSYVDRIIDVQALEKGIVLGIKEVPENRTAWHYQMQNFRQRGLKTSVKHLCNKYEIPYDENSAHDALYDNNLVLQIFRKQINLIEV